jgi:sodium/hydrogen antiporter
LITVESGLNDGIVTPVVMLALAGAASARGPGELVFLEQAGGLVSLLVWFAFGALVIPIMVERIDLRIVLYAILSLTLIRMVPVFEELGPAAAGALSIIGLTVLLSVVAHGFTARPLSSWFGRTVPADGRPTRTEQA